MFEALLIALRNLKEKEDELMEISQNYLEIRTMVIAIGSS